MGQRTMLLKVWMGRRPVCWKGQWGHRRSLFREVGSTRDPCSGAVGGQVIVGSRRDSGMACVQEGMFGEQETVFRKGHW